MTAEKPGSTRPRKRPRKRRWLRIFGLATMLGGVAIVALHQSVLWAAAGRIYSVGLAPYRDLAVVLGASVRANGQPSPMLGERLQAAAQLYAQGRVARILVSGDYQRAGYDEVGPMARTLEQAGVPAAKILRDPAGLRTLDSIYRARDVYGATKITVVSNPFHVPRAVYLARAAGLDAVGVAAEFGVRYSARTRFRHELREAAARVLAVLDVHVLGTAPRVAGAVQGPFRRGTPR